MAINTTTMVAALRDAITKGIDKEYKEDELTIWRKPKTNILVLSFSDGTRFQLTVERLKE